jgi:predicted RNA-binding Zn-ribbon protein involved in translation (DUF1610 family)
VKISKSQVSSGSLKKKKRAVIDIPNHLRISCPDCGNTSEFLEVADGVILTTRYVQNSDGSFSQEIDESEVLGEVKLYCGECGADLSRFHKRFLEMLF